MTAHTPSGQLASIQFRHDDAVLEALRAAMQRRLAELELDHPCDENIRRNAVARLDAALSDLRVVACRMREDDSLRAEVIDRDTTANATVVDRADGTRTTVQIDGTVTCEPQPITEDSPAVVANVPEVLL